MDPSTVAVLALSGAVIVQAALLVLVVILHQRVDAALRLDNSRLQNLVVARNPSEFAQLQRASTPKPEPTERPEPEPALIGS